MAKAKGKAKKKVKSKVKKAAKKVTKKAKKKVAKKEIKRAKPKMPESRKKALEEYDKGMRLFTRKDYSKAVIRFQNILDNFPEEREFGDRSRIYLKICERYSTKTKSPRLSSFEDYYYHGIHSLNNDDFGTAQKDFEAALKLEPKNDGIHYLLGVLYFKKGDSANGGKYLGKSITLNPVNKCYALNDPDLEKYKADKNLEKLLDKKGKAG